MAQDRSTKDKKMAADLKSRGVERTRGRCEGCLHYVTINSSQSRFRHKCSNR